jgi:NADPH:quinone reductase
LEFDFQLEPAFVNMKEAFVNTDLSVEIKDSPVPKPGPGDVLIKVAVSGSNPKDWKYPKW